MWRLTKAMVEINCEHWAKRWIWSSCAKLALSTIWIHGLIAQSVRVSERNSLGLRSNPTTSSAWQKKCRLLQYHVRFIYIIVSACMKVLNGHSQLDYYLTHFADIYSKVFSICFHLCSMLDVLQIRNHLKHYIFYWRILHVLFLHIVWFLWIILAIVW